MYSRFNNFIVFFLCEFGLSVVGCGGTNVPNDFPKTLPFTITVLNDGSPIEGVNIRLSTTTPGNWTASGKTDVSGVAEMQTISGSYSRKGVPEGSYKVVLAKPLLVDPTLLGPEPTNRFEQVAYDAKAKEIRSKMTPEVPPVYSDDKTTLASVEVTKGKNQETIDVGKQ